MTLDKVDQNSLDTIIAQMEEEPKEEGSIQEFKNLEV